MFLFYFLYLYASEVERNKLLGKRSQDPSCSNKKNSSSCLLSRGELNEDDFRSLPSQKICEAIKQSLKKIEISCLETEQNEISEIIFKFLFCVLSDLNDYNQLKKSFRNMYESDDLLYLENLDSKGLIMLFFILQSRDVQKIFALEKLRTLDEQTDILNTMKKDFSYVEYYDIIPQDENNSEKANITTSNKIKCFQTKIECFKFMLNHLIYHIQKNIDTDKLYEKVEDDIFNFISIFLPEYHYFKANPSFLHYNKLEFSTNSRLCIFMYKYMVLHSYISFKRLLDINMKNLSEGLPYEVFKQAKEKLLFKESIKLRTILTFFMKLANHSDYAMLLEKINEFYIVSYFKKDENASLIEFLDTLFYGTIYNLFNPSKYIDFQKIVLLLNEAIAAIHAKDNNKIKEISSSSTLLDNLKDIKFDENYKKNEHMISSFLKAMEESRYERIKRRRGF